MDDQHLESCLRKLRSSSSEPDSVNASLEERIMKEFAVVKLGKRRAKRVVFALVIFAVCGLGFLAAGGDAAVVNYVAPPTEKGEDGKQIPKYQPMWKPLIHHIHEHLRRLHSRGSVHTGGSSNPRTSEQ